MSTFFDQAEMDYYCMVMGIDINEPETPEDVIVGSQDPYSIPDPAFVIKLDGTYGCRSLRHGVESVGDTKEEARKKLAVEHGV